MYSYYLPFRTFFKDDTTIEKSSSWVEFREKWNTEEEKLIILPLAVFDLIGLDIRFVFREFGRNDNTRFLLIGTNKQIEFSLTQNESFLGNLIEHLMLPYDLDTLEYAIMKKIAKLEQIGKGRKFSNK